jgi:hypothetical protein
MRLRCAISGQTHEFDFAADAPVRIARTDNVQNLSHFQD